MDFTIYLLSHNKKCCFSNLGNMCMFYFHFYGLHASDYTYSTLVEYILYVVKLLKFTNQLSVLQNKSKISFFFLPIGILFAYSKVKRPPLSWKSSKYVSAILWGTPTLGIQICSLLVPYLLEREISNAFQNKIVAIN